jgi:hypothetical protein
MVNADGGAGGEFWGQDPMHREKWGCRAALDAMLKPDVGPDAVGGRPNDAMRAVQRPSRAGRPHGRGESDARVNSDADGGGEFCKPHDQREMGGCPGAFRHRIRSPHRLRQQSRSRAARARRVTVHRCKHFLWEDDVPRGMSFT